MENKQDNQQLSPELIEGLKLHYGTRLIELEHDLTKERAIYKYVEDYFEGVYPEFTAVMGNIASQQRGRLERMQDLAKRAMDVQTKLQEFNNQ